jgi:hypothetical protein
MTIFLKFAVTKNESLLAKDVQNLPLYLGNWDLHHILTPTSSVP